MNASLFSDPALRKRLGVAVILLVAAWFVNAGFTSTSYVNCRLATCGWFDLGKIGIGVAAIRLAWLSQQEASETTRKLPLAIALRLLVMLAGGYMLVHGAGLAGPSPCPLVKPDC